MKSFNMGLLIILIGAIYLLGNLGVISIPRPSLWGLWPLIPLIGGLNVVVHGMSRYRQFGGLDWKGVLTGLFWAAVGAGFLVRNLGLWHWNVSASEIAAPLFLVWLGIQIISKTATAKGAGRSSFSNAVGELRLNEPWTLTDNTVSLWVGEIFVDVTKAFMPDRDSHLEISAFAGECTVLVPRELSLNVNVDFAAGEAKILDQYEGGVLRKGGYKSPDFETAQKRLTIDITMKFGEITVRAV